MTSSSFYTDGPTNTGAAVAPAAPASFYADPAAAASSAQQAADSAVAAANSAAAAALASASAAAAAAGKANIDSPTFTGVPSAPTPFNGDNSTRLATTAWVQANAVGAAPATATPAMDGTAAVGASAKYAREDHVHPTDTSRASVTYVNAQIATVASVSYVDSQDATKAPLASPALTGTPTAPTAAAGTNTTQIATTAFVLANPTSRTGTPIDSSTAVLAAWTTIGTAGAIPIDDTPPQNTEGTQVIQATITPKATTNKLRCRFSCSIVVAAGDNPTFALFSSGSTDAKQARYYSTPAGYAQLALLECEFVPGVTTPITVSVRASTVAGNGYINGNSAGRVFGGSQQAILIVEEIAE